MNQNTIVRWRKNQITNLAHVVEMTYDDTVTPNTVTILLVNGDTSVLTVDEDVQRLWDVYCSMSLNVFIP